MECGCYFSINCILFSEGGTISNLYSIVLARYHFYPEVKTRGMGALPQLALFTSEHVTILSIPWGLKLHVGLALIGRVDNTLELVPFRK